MGLTYSSFPEGFTDNRIVFTNLADTEVENLVKLVSQQKVLPVLDYSSFRIVIEVAFHRQDFSTIFLPLWDVFQDADVCNTQEVISGIILLGSGTWISKLKFIFDQYKCTGTNEMTHDDICMALQCIIAALCRIWGVSQWSPETMIPLIESVADNAFVKLEKELEDGLSREEFVAWAFDRFQETRSISDCDALRKILESPNKP